MNRQERKLARLIEKAKKAWARLREVELEFCDHWQNTTAEERKVVVGDACNLPVTDYFNNMGA